jgi:hypothetical protein
MDFPSLVVGESFTGVFGIVLGGGEQARYRLCSSVRYWVAMEFDFDASVEVRFAEDLTYEDVAPVLDGFARAGVFQVRASRVGWSGPAAGGPEIGIIVEAAVAAVATVGAAAFTKSFCEELGKDSYKLVRTALLAAVDRLRSRNPEEVRAVVPLAIRIGNVEICIGGSLHEPGRLSDEWSDAWLVEHLKRAQKIVDAELGREPKKRDDEPVGGKYPCSHWIGRPDGEE